MSYHIHNLAADLPGGINENTEEIRITFGSGEFYTDPPWRTWRVLSVTEVDEYGSWRVTGEAVDDQNVKLDEVLPGSLSVSGKIGNDPL